MREIRGKAAAQMWRNRDFYLCRGNVKLEGRMKIKCRAALPKRPTMLGGEKTARCHLRVGANDGNTEPALRYRTRYERDSRHSFG